MTPMAKIGFLMMGLIAGTILLSVGGIWLTAEIFAHVFKAVVGTHP